MRHMQTHSHFFHHQDNLAYPTRSTGLFDRAPSLGGHNSIYNSFKQTYLIIYFIIYFFFSASLVGSTDQMVVLLVWRGTTLT